MAHERDSSFVPGTGGTWTGQAAGASSDASFDCIVPCPVATHFPADVFSHSAQRSSPGTAPMVYQATVGG
ncbi:MAG: hypothetical protein ACK43N_16735, partial [Pirellulaceae bacterium]